MPRQERILRPHGWARPLQSRSRLRAPVAGEHRPGGRSAHRRAPAARL